MATVSDNLTKASASGGVIAIVRGLHGRASRVSVLGMSGQRVVVSGGGKDHVLGWPSNDVFEYDAGLLARISRESSPDRRDELWGEAEPLSLEHLPEFNKLDT